MTTNWESGNKQEAKQKPIKQKSNSDAIRGTALGSWSRQQKGTMIAGFAILGALLGASACSTQSPKPALVSVSGGVPASVMPSSASPSLPAFVTQSSAVAPARKQAKKHAANVTYSDANYGISFLYPRKFVLVTGEKEKTQLEAIGDVPMNFIKPGGVAVATVKVPVELYRGTDFESAFFQVNLNRGISEEECAGFAFTEKGNGDGEEVDAERVKVGSTEMEKTSNFSANIMKQAETEYYHNYENGTCYEYVLGLGTEGFAANGGSEHVNRHEVFARLENILETVKIRPREPEQEAIQANTLSGDVE